MTAGADEGRFSEVARLVRAASGGDAGAFRQLLGMHRQAISSTLYACGVRCPETALDLAQDVAVRAWQNLGRLEDPRSFPAWVRRIAANAARDHLRRQAVRREDSLETACDLEAGDDPHQLAERVAELRLMLAALAEEDAELVDLLVARAEGVAVEELAGRLGISEGALKMRLTRARKRLRERLRGLQRDAGPMSAS